MRTDPKGIALEAKREKVKYQLIGACSQCDVVVFDEISGDCPAYECRGKLRKRRAWVCKEGGVDCPPHTYTRGYRGMAFYDRMDFIAHDHSECDG